MDTLLIQVTNKKARGLLHELEELHLIKVLKENQPKQKLSRKYAGKLPADIVDELQDSITENRYEWWKDKEFVAELDRMHEAMESGAEREVTLEELKISIEAIRLEMYGK